MNSRVKFVLTTAVFACFSGTGATRSEAKNYTATGVGSSVEFSAVGKPGFLRINGHGAKVSGRTTLSGDSLEGTFTVKLDEFTTGIDLRDEHMKTKYLETAKYPHAVLSLVVPAAKLATAGDVSFKGKLTLHGVEKDISGTATLTPSSDQKTVATDAQFQIKLSEFKIDIPSYLGITVAEDVDVHVQFTAEATP